MRLIIPSLAHKDQAMAMLQEFLNANEKIPGSSSFHCYDNYEKWLNKVINDMYFPEKNHVCANTYFAVIDNYLVGFFQIRHLLTPQLLLTGGHIGYSIRPSERRKGYASKGLQKALDICEDLNINNILITCNKENIGSAKTIIANGGILENEVLEDNGNIVCRYWIKSLKKKYPILEYDETKDAIINPQFEAQKYPQMPPKLIITFFKEVIDELLLEQKIRHFFTIKGENALPVYLFTEHNIAIIHGIVGGAACGGFYDILIALGVSETLFCGGGGALQKELFVGRLVVVDAAIRDEGMSYHYLPPSREVLSDTSLKMKIINYLEKQQIDYLLGKVWTTDAFYRETKKIVDLRKKEGALIVEMEQASLIAISKFRNVQYGAIIYAGDDLSNPIWDNRGWNSRTSIRYQLVQVALAIMLE